MPIVFLTISESPPSSYPESPLSALKHLHNQQDEKGRSMYVQAWQHWIVLSFCERYFGLLSLMKQKQQGVSLSEAFSSMWTVLWFSMRD